MRPTPMRRGRFGAPSNNKFTFLLLAGLLLVVLAVPASAQKHSAQPPQAAKTKSGYDDIPRFGGPRSVGANLEEDNAVRVPLLRFSAVDEFFKPWFDWKGRLKKNYGLSFGLDYTALVQGANQSLGQDRAASGIFRLFGNWTLLGKGSKNNGSLVFKVENRHKYGSYISPQDLGFAAGYNGLTAAPFNDMGWGVTNLYWKQNFKQSHFNFVAGVVDTTDYVDLYGLSNPWTSFSNLVFLTNPTIPVPNQGLGAALGAMATDNIYLVGGLADANGDPTEPGDWLKSFFNDREYFYHLEVGWASSFARRYLDNIHLTGWFADERKNAGVPDGWGLAFSASKFFDDKWMPFLRAGYAHDGGALLKASLGSGIGYYWNESKDLLGFGLNWGRPQGDGLDDQYTAELFYRLQVTQNLAVTPDLQLLINPALNPDEDQIWIFGLRGRIAF
jgi:porin